MHFLYFKILLWAIIVNLIVKRKYLNLQEDLYNAYLNKFKVKRNVGQRKFVKYKKKTF